MKNLLNRLIRHEILTQAEAREALTSISKGDMNAAQMACFMTVYMMRPITVGELAGFRQALLDLCIPIGLAAYNAIDLCGTGGDGKDTFNISTLASFITAGAGVNVAKHGNYGVSSISGSSNVMEAMGIRFSNDSGFLEKCISEAGICILHAPLFHPAMKMVAPIRKELGVRTFFNMLGPLVNPSFPKNQLCGVFSLELARMYAYLFQQTDLNYAVVHALDGYDEITLTDKAKIVTREAEKMILPSDFGLIEIEAEAIKGGADIASSAALFHTIIRGNGSEAQNNVVCANAAMAIATVTGDSLTESFEKATESLRSGAALRSLQKLQQISAA